MAKYVTAEKFDELVLQADKPVLVDFFATWCGPCRMLSPTIEEIAKEMEGKAYVYKLDIDESPNIAAQYRVASVPTVILFKDGQPVKRSVGARPKHELMTIFD